MIYVMSDLHGFFEKYRKMLQTINLCKDDQLYILGDVVDRGPDGIKILMDVHERDNVIFLKGNHDDTAERLLNPLICSSEIIKSSKYMEAMKAWISDGGYTTLQQFLLCNTEEQLTIMQILNSAKSYEEICVNESVYLLAHTVPDKELMIKKSSLSEFDYLWGEPDYDEIYFENKILVTGHTPTELIAPSYKGKIWMGNHHIAIDCGAAFGNSLGCLCLDTMEEFYV